MGDLSAHFNSAEFRCRCGCGGGPGLISPRLIALLERTRQIYGKPMRITSGYRCESHNAAVGGKPNSAHTTGEAADIFCTMADDRHALLGAAFAAGARRIGVDNSFIHLDVSTTLPQDVCWTYGAD